MKRFITSGEQLALYVDYQMKLMGKRNCISKLAKHWDKTESSVYRKLTKSEIMNMPLKELYTLANVLEISPGELIEQGKA